ncbi:hypothetical protein BJ085DRAFT_39593 [Dimargaris cristalligena]|uniref:SWIRM domain-containing protein n=1 Tax=Dimargaris cristalligena TaxID=215637 RepID=A0A4P9ZLJ3_9FUNG|nr:hypothetical protein BJ085DRAFT_39593 [Dimargaris cristalligena]|eukprot:RKP33968.1 hypothetical protein BJ085DRAFT_39593 [Dimargaris cristalligena]
MPEFFRGKSNKTPERYLKIHNYMLNVWHEVQPNYLTKVRACQGLRDCGDVNAIGRVHTFLEQIKAINRDAIMSAVSLGKLQAKGSASSNKPANSGNPEEVGGDSEDYTETKTQHQMDDHERITCPTGIGEGKTADHEATNVGIGFRLQSMFTRTLGQNRVDLAEPYPTPSSPSRLHMLLSPLRHNFPLPRDQALTFVKRMGQLVILISVMNYTIGSGSRFLQDATRDDRHLELSIVDPSAFVVVDKSPWSRKTITHPPPSFVNVLQHLRIANKKRVFLEAA